MALSNSSTEELLIETKGKVAVITLNRPDRLNAISTAMLNELSTKIVEANKDPGIRCIILTGSGKGFCAGLWLPDLECIAHANESGGVVDSGMLHEAARQNDAAFWVEA